MHVFRSQVAGVAIIIFLCCSDDAALAIGADALLTSSSSTDAITTSSVDMYCRVCGKKVVAAAQTISRGTGTSGLNGD